MLILTRRENESILIGGDIEVRITDIRPNRIKIGIIAPPYIGVYRKEIAPEAADADTNPYSGMNRIQHRG